MLLCDRILLNVFPAAWVPTRWRVYVLLFLRLRGALGCSLFEIANRIVGDASVEYVAFDCACDSAVDVDHSAAARRLEHFLKLVVAGLWEILESEAAARLSIVVIRGVREVEVVADGALRRVSLLRSLLRVELEDYSKR